MTNRLATPDERLEKLRATLSGARAETRSGRRLRLNRPGNLLYGVALHAAARLDKGLPLTDLEERLVGLVSEIVPDKAEIAALGRVYREATARGAIDFLPEQITSRPLELGYSSADLKADMPAIVEAMRAQPNVSIVDLGKHDPAQPIDSDEFTAAMGEYGGGVTLFTSSEGNDTQTGLWLVNIRLDKFQCHRKSGEVDRDEIYWGLSAGSDATRKQSSTTREYGSIQQATWATFDGGTYLFSGLVNNHLTAEIECWEADHSPGSWYTALRNGLADIAEWAIDKAVAMTEAGDNDTEKGAAVLALFAIGTGIINWILGFFTNDDDLVTRRTFGFDHAALRKQSIQAPGVVWFNFDGGDGGMHRLFTETTMRPRPYP
jgi:hypothetical protein